MSVSENDKGGSVYLIAAVMGFISTAGLIFNLIVIGVITVLKEYKNTTHWYVLNLALADCMFVILLPLNLVQSLYKRWMFGFPLCVLYQGAFYINYYAGVLFLAVMSFDRYIAIVHPVSAKWRKIRTKFGSWVMTIAVWIISILAATPLMMKTTLDEVCNFNFEKVHPECVEHGIPARSCGAWLIAYYNTPTNETLDDFSPEEFVDKFYPDETMEIIYDYEGSGGLEGQDDIVELEYSQELEDYSCSHSDDPNYRSWIYTNFFLTFVIPLSVMSACYTAILWRVQHPRVPASKPKIFTTKNRMATAEKNSRHMDKNIRITIVVVSLVAAFVVCWLPFHAMVLAKIRGINLSSGGCDKLKNAVMLMAYFNSLLNPTLYTFLGVNFYKRLRNACSKIGCKRRHKIKVKRGHSNVGTNGKANGYAAPVTKMSRVSATSEQIQQLSVHIPLQTIAQENSKHDTENEQNGGIEKLSIDVSEDVTML